MTINSDPQLNDADLELLSAYIDSRLDAGERAALERRLSQEPVLRGVLDELRATVALLHDLEPLRPPRSFTIAATAAAPRRFWAFPWPAISSALVALVCLLTFGYALIRSGGSSAPASAPAPAAMQEAAAPTAAPAAAGGAAQDSAMRQGSAAPTTAPAAAAAPMAAEAAATAAPAAEAPTAAPAAEAPITAIEAQPAPAAAAPTAAPAAEAPLASEAPVPTLAPTMVAASGATGPVATAPPATPELSTAADSAAPTAAAPPAVAALKGTPTTSQQPYTALVATSELSSPGTVALEQPPVAPTANSAPSGGSSNAWPIAGVVVLALLIAAGIGLALRRKA
jgi:hypothetical protein